jgi:hypothetical protein
MFSKKVVFIKINEVSEKENIHQPKAKDAALLSVYNIVLKIRL